ncbi:MAG TPA: TIR domain-containing protein [Gammaproteobacteria bacterium]|nr:TIR domain-containing protein [Gammaproteobacteria bacterium]
MGDAYRAFISYSHADEAWASWLQRALERYRVPGRLRAARADLPRRLYPVFRDREELASSSDLGESIRAALARAEALVVICSPAAAASRWVNEEIRLFRAIAPGRPVLCLLVDGSPEASSADCAFPPALLRDGTDVPLPEPLAADPREGGDGRRGALLKIAAGLLGVGVDSLRQRDQQRRLRAASGLAALASVIAVVTIGLAINAQLAREEAELRRGQAENLIGFMLGDLRSRLQPLGRLDVLDAVGDQAMTYFAQLGDKGSEEEILARAMALRQIGEVRFQQGQLQEALDAFEDSRAIAATLYEAYPQQDRYLFEFGQAEFWLGYVAWEQDRLEAAGESMLAYMAHARALLDRDPDRNDYRLELAYAYTNLGAIARERRAQETALQHFRDSIATAQPLADASPEDTRLLMLLSENWSWVGSALLDLGRLAEAENAFAAGLGYAESAYRLSESPLHNDQVSSMAAFLGDVHLRRGELEAGRARLAEALAIEEALAEHDSANARWRRAGFRTRRQLAEIAVVAGWSEADQAMLDIAIAGFESLLAQEVSSAEFRHGLALAHRTQAMAHLQAGRPLDAVASAREAGEILAAGGPELAAQRASAAAIEDTLGLALAAAGDPAAAAVAWQAGLAALPPPDARDLAQKAMFCRLAAWLGRTEEARAAAQELRALGYADPRLPLPVFDHH